VVGLVRVCLLGVNRRVGEGDERLEPGFEREGDERLEPGFERDGGRPVTILLVRLRKGFVGVDAALSSCVTAAAPNLEALPGVPNAKGALTALTGVLSLDFDNPTPIDPGGRSRVLFTGSLSLCVLLMLKLLISLSTLPMLSVSIDLFRGLTWYFEIVLA
jgi:hypothetical protein